MSQRVLEFRSGGPIMALFGSIGIAGLAINWALNAKEHQWFSVVLAFVVIYQLRTGFRTWRVPAVRLTNDDLQVFVQGRIAHYLPWEKIQSIEKGFNSTTLRLNDGARVSVKSTEFLWGSEVDAFRDAVRSRLKARAFAG